MASQIPNFNGGFGNAYTQVDRYDVTSPGIPFAIQLQTNYTRLQVSNQTTWGTAPATPVPITSWWTQADTQGSAYMLTSTASSPIVESQYTATNGIYVRASGYPMPSAPITGGTTITAATPPICTVPSTAGLVNGMNVQLYNIAGMFQITGYVFTIGNVTPTTFTLPNLPAASFAGGATSFTVQPVNIFPVTPTANYITAASSVGVNTVFELAFTHNFFVGMTCTLTIPTQYGIGWDTTGALTAVYTVTAVGATLNGSTNTITINLNSSSFGPFAFPSSATAATTKIAPAQVIPVGQVPPPYLPISSTATYQNTTLMNPVPYLTLGSVVCGALNDQLTIWGYTENYITQGSPNIYSPMF